MVTGIPNEVLEFFALMPHNHKALYEWLSVKGRAYDERMRRERDDITLRQVQGRAQELNEMLDLVQQAPAILEKKRKAP